MTGMRALKSMKSSVKVPGLSKHNRLIIPPTMVLFGEVQKVCFCFIFYKAKIIPKVMLTGRPGGTVTVTKSRNFTNKSKGSAYGASFTTKAT